MSTATLAMVGLFAGLLLGMSPVLLSSFTTYITSMIGRKVSNKRYSLAGILFILYFVLFILFFSVGFSTFISYFSTDTQLSIALSVSLIGIGTGTALIRRYFYPEPLINPPKEVSSILNDRTTKKTGILNLIALTLVVSYATLPTIGIAIALMSVMSVLLGPSAIIWSLPFTIGLITPIYIILAMISSGTKPSAILAWKEKSKPVMRLYGGMAIVTLAWLLLYIISGGEVN